MLNASCIRPRTAALAGALLATFALTALAQTPAASSGARLQTLEQSPMAIAADINLRRSVLYGRRDLDGAASLYTPDAAYIQLMPVLQMLKGKDQIKGHFDELISAGALAIVPTVREATLTSEKTILVGGDYAVLSRNNGIDETDRSDGRNRPAVSGHFSQVLRLEADGTWRIAMHAFARPEAVTAAELDTMPHD